MQDSQNAAPRGDARFALMILALGLFLSARSVADPDLWGHVRYGQDMLSSHQIVMAAQYSYLTEGLPWINHEWLSEVTFAAVFNTLGPQGLLGLKALILLAILGLSYRHLRAQDASTMAAGAVVLMVAYTITIGSRTIRPQLFTYFFFLLVLLAIHKADTGRLRALWFIPPIIALWANFHGGFLSGLGILVVWTGVRITGIVWAAVRERSSWMLPCGGIVLPVLVSLLATLVNPYGYRQMVFLWEALRVPRPDIVEWQPLTITNVEGLAYMVLLGVSILAISTALRRRSPALVAVLACTAILPFQAFRHLPLFAIAVPVIAGEHIGWAWRRWLAAGQNEPGMTARPQVQWAASILPLAGGLLFGGAVLQNSTRIPIDPVNLDFPVRAVQMLKTSGVHGNMAVFFNWGQYALWYLGPNVKISYDGRRESLYSDEIRAMNNNWTLGLGEWDAVLDRRPTDMALLDKRMPVYNLMRLKPGWTLAYDDTLCALFVRHDSPLLQTLRSMPVRSDLPVDGAGLAFP